MSALRRAGTLVALPLLAVPLAFAAQPAAPVDDDLLEFLGSVDSSDPGWHDYLAGSGDLKGRKRATTPAPAPAPAPKNDNKKEATP